MWTTLKLLAVCCCRFLRFAFAGCRLFVLLLLLLLLLQTALVCLFYCVRNQANIRVCRRGNICHVLACPHPLYRSHTPHSLHNAFRTNAFACSRVRWPLQVSCRVVRAGHFPANTRTAFASN
ncbi:hypothetical protein PTSG_12152 [Salpingoeca rosetta]|uniref:Uncharacterized protein n=1 Tax=Salpingoeca rosetta (strain ATCC 50818 / BSB-021) TaxID=946362 RepID=F2U752_SALR5|nr:uncharacterized protein PTSG_12152 [Salpingoeca rosetta]EGD83684.1 hypothetical protein PTSG_12152 [Salpingoeca rosetta]|eukprot:XP_004995188.1 hypothetical protein PTSG_12152 [Salpingoeca rosetta]